MMSNSLAIHMWVALLTYHWMCECFKNGFVNEIEFWNLAHFDLSIKSRHLWHPFALHSMCSTVSVTQVEVLNLSIWTVNSQFSCFCEYQFFIIIIIQLVSFLACISLTLVSTQGWTSPGNYDSALDEKADLLGLGLCGYCGCCWHCTCVYLCHIPYFYRLSLLFWFCNNGFFSAGSICCPCTSWSSTRMFIHIFMFVQDFSV